MTHDEFEKLTSDMETVSALLKYAAESNRDATEAMKFAQAALNASDAINRKWMCIGANRPPKRPIQNVGFEGINSGDVRQGY